MSLFPSSLKGLQDKRNFCRACAEDLHHRAKTSAASGAALLRALPDFVARYTSPLNSRPALLAVDYGTSKIGLAHAAGLRARAEPLGTVRLPASSGAGAKGGASS